MKQSSHIIVPEGLNTVLLHACCAPCSSAIVEWLLMHEIEPVIYYFNPNIFPRREYDIRKDESKRHAESLGLQWIDGDYDHESWLAAVRGLEQEPERGGRCAACSRFRLGRAAAYAASRGLRVLATTLASSRWKDLDQVNAAGSFVCSSAGAGIAGRQNFASLIPPTACSGSSELPPETSGCAGPLPSGDGPLPLTMPPDKDKFPWKGAQGVEGQASLLARFSGGTAAPASTLSAIQPVVKEVQTFYEQLFLEQGYPITYLSFVIDHEGPFVSPRDPEQFDSKAWRAAEGPRLLFGHDSAETRRQKLHAAED